MKDLEYGMDMSGSKIIPVVCYFEGGINPSSSSKGGQFFDHLDDYERLKYECAE
jgi:hypothetical protein